MTPNPANNVRHRTTIGIAITTPLLTRDGRLVVARGGGGGVFVGPTSRLSASSTVFAYNQASGGGGAISFTAESRGLVSGCDIHDNGAIDGARAYLEYHATVSITGTTFFENYANEEGGGIFCSNSKLNLTSSTFSANKDGVDLQGESDVTCSKDPPGTICEVTGDTTYVSSCIPEAASGNGKEMFPVIASVGIFLGVAGLLMCSILVCVAVSWKRKANKEKKMVWDTPKEEKEGSELLQDYD